MELVRLEEEDRRYIKFKDAKAIPFFFHLGFYTVSLKSPVMAMFKEHWAQHSMPYNGRCRVQGICFGRKVGNAIQIQQVFHFRYDSIGKILIRNNEYNTDLEFFGIYSNGDILDTMDISILQNLCQIVAQSVFLIKFNWSDKLNNIQSVEVFENVFDIATGNLSPRIISMQAFKNHPNDCLLSYQNNGSCADEIFYITFHEENFINCGRFDLNISPSQKVQLEESSKIFQISPTFQKHKYTIYKHVFNKNLKFQDLCAEKNCLKIARDLCEDIKVNLRFMFYIWLDRVDICCAACILNFNTCSTGKTVTESVENAAGDFLKVLLMGQYLKD